MASLDSLTVLLRLEIELELEWYASLALNLYCNSNEMREKKKKHKLKDGGRYSSVRLGYDCGRSLALNPLNALKKARHMVWGKLFAD